MDDLEDATRFIKSVKEDPELDKAIKHVTISGHGNPSTLVLGEDRIQTSELATRRATEAKDFFEELRPILMHTGEARSTVFLDSCSTSKQPATGAPLAEHVADKLPGVEIHAFEDLMYPAYIYIQEDFWKDAKFECTNILKQKGACVKLPYVLEPISHLFWINNIKLI